MFFGADAEVFEEVDCIVCDGLLVERTNCDDGELRTSFLFEFSAKGFEALARCGGNDAGLVGDVALGNNLLYVIRECGSERRKKQERADGEPQQAERTQEAQMVSSLELCTDTTVGGKV